VSDPHGQIMSQRIALARMYEYRRMLPHYQKAGRALFVTFCKGHRNPFSAEARDLVLRSCVHDHGKRYQLHAAVVMPEHVHLLLTPLVDEKGWPYGLPAILKLIRGVSARAINKLSGSCGPVWQEESFDHVLRSHESFEDKLEYIRQNPVRRGLVGSPEEYPWLWVEHCLCGSDTLARRS
jgi:REP element-mobilizing transposase RayT